MLLLFWVLRRIGNIPAMKRRLTLPIDPWATSLTYENSYNHITHMIIIMLIKRRKPHCLLYESSMVLHLNKLHPRMLCAKFGWIYLAVLEKKIFEFRQCIPLFRNNLPLEKGGALHLNKLELLIHKNALCKVWSKSTQWFWDF